MNSWIYNAKIAACLAYGFKLLGLQNAVIAPGSRSAPLILAFDHVQGIKSFSVIDERSAAFFALGQAKRTRVASAVIVTSGTAVAELTPAVVEAKCSGIPLILITADRPVDLRGTGANQTIDQVKFFTSNVLAFAELVGQEFYENPVPYVWRTISAIWSQAHSSPMGPVHINAPLPEPLIPSNPREFYDVVDDVVIQMNQTLFPRTKLSLVNSEKHEVPTELAKAFANTNGIIYIGSIPSLSFSEKQLLVEQVNRLAVRYGMPILIDPLSGMRSNIINSACLVCYYDIILRNKNISRMLKPELIFRIGALGASKSVIDYLSYHRPFSLIMDPQNLRQDPVQLDSFYVSGNPVDILKKLLGDEGGTRADDKWIRTWSGLDMQVKKKVELYGSGIKDLWEYDVYKALSQSSKKEAVYFIGSSLPVRDIETMMPPHADIREFHANRGTSGIDGLLSTALGICSVSAYPVYAIVGDVSLFHDLNGLNICMRENITNLRLIVINNSGGGIFDLLPQSSYGDAYERLFFTPPGIDICNVAQLFGMRYVKVSHKEEVTKIFDHNEGCTIFELQVDRRLSLQHRYALYKVADELQYDA